MVAPAIARATRRPGTRLSARRARRLVDGAGPLRALTVCCPTPSPSRCSASPDAGHFIAPLRGVAGERSAASRQFCHRTTVLGKNVEDATSSTSTSKSGMLACAVESARALRDALAPADGAGGAFEATGASHEDDALAPSLRFIDFSTIPHAELERTSPSRACGAASSPRSRQMRDGAGDRARARARRGRRWPRRGRGDPTPEARRYGSTGQPPAVLRRSTPRRSASTETRGRAGGCRAAAAATGAAHHRVLPLVRAGCVSMCLEKWRKRVFSARSTGRAAVAAAAARASRPRPATRRRAALVGGAFLAAIALAVRYLWYRRWGRGLSRTGRCCTRRRCGDGGGGGVVRAGGDEGLGRGKGRGTLGAPVVVTTACMTGAARVMFWWLCEPDVGGWLWKRP